MRDSASLNVSRDGWKRDEVSKSDVRGTENHCRSGDDRTVV